MFQIGKKNTAQLKQIESQIAERQKLYHSVFDTPEGKRVLEDLRKRCYIDTTTYNDSHGRMSFNEGRRSLYVHITNMLTRDLKDLLEALTKE